MPKKLLVITGPTAAGKTGLSIRLAKAFDGEVVSADSMQVYRGMDIGTAKPSLSERDGVPHHMLDVADPWEPYSVARYVEEAALCVEAVLTRGRLPILVGGTGLYIDSLLSGRCFARPPEDETLRNTLKSRYDREGGEALWRELREIDPEAAARLHPRDKKRVLRALEVFLLTGKTISAHNRETQRAPRPYETLKIALTAQDRADLYRRINQRVEEMVHLGLFHEVEGLLQAGLSPGSTAMQAIGYKEAARALSGAVPTDLAIAEIQQESRRYAKRQLSWFRRDPEIKWLTWAKTPDIENLLQISTQFCFAAGIMEAGDKGGKVW